MLKQRKFGLFPIARLTAALLIWTLLLPPQQSFGTERVSSTPMMTLSLHRLWHSKHGTFGVLDVEGKQPIYTLEETEKEIPKGTYKIELTYSPRFRRLLPLLIVPGRSAIRIHAGNWPRDSSGCVLVGAARGDNMIAHSLEALEPLVKQIQQALDAGDEVQIVIF